VDDTDKITDPFTIEQLAIQQMMKGFNLMFVHFPNGDLEGHDHGWMSNRQLKQYGRDDESFGYILEALKNLGLYESTLIIVTADHGGHDTTHGSDRLEDMTIPWIISGLGIQSRQLTTPVHTTDTAATAAFALGLQLPAEWDGVPVFEAFDLSAPVRDFPVCE
jgi:predicted AlkP superfamily pyrophosphatase or phosphodiesterase